MYLLYTAVFISLFISFIADRAKTYKAIKIAFKKFVKIMPAFASVFIMVSIVTALVPDGLIVNYLGKSNMLTGVLLASIFGSITVMPGFIAFPLCGILLKEGVAYAVIAAFATTLMMVGFVTFPVEKRYFGVKVTVTRNALSFVVALIVAIMTGLFFGEIL